MSSFLIVSIAFLGVFFTGCFYGYFFPIKYTEEIATASEEFGVDYALIASVINSESRYDKNAVSHKGAVGLMQLMPSTATYLAEKLGYGEFDLYDPKDNITLGTYYLSILLETYGNETTALCSYNAGSGNVNRWLSLYSADGQTLDKIPFEETRNYVKKCLRSQKYYKTKVDKFVLS